MAENGRSSFLGGPITLREIITVVGVVAGVMVFYFTGQTTTGERINKVESELSTRMTTADTALGDRISKLETRAAVMEQHQVQTDAATADNRNALNSFAVEVRSQLGKISDQIAELRPLITGKSDGARR